MEKLTLDMQQEATGVIDQVGINGAEPDLNPWPLTVATYNIHKGVTSLRSTPRVLALKKAIAEFHADIVFLQEVQGRHDRHHARGVAGADRRPNRLRRWSR